MRPPQTVSLGRQKTDLVQIYLEQQRTKLYDPSKQQLSDSVHVSLFTGLTLVEYITAQLEHCLNAHAQPCKLCSGMLQVATTIHREGYYTLFEAFRIVSPNVEYTAHHVRSKFLQMPFASLRVTSNQGYPSAFSLNIILLLTINSSLLF